MLKCDWALLVIHRLTALTPSAIGLQHVSTRLCALCTLCLHTDIMKGTSIFQFKSWPKIHQPLPRTPRESQQLLNALTTSFRRQLDGAYPASPASANEARPLLNTQSSAQATDQHLQTILDNPLFRIIPMNKASRVVEQPMAVLDQMAATGSLTSHTINDCLKYQLLLSKSPEQMKASRAASRVVEWFWASDGAARQALLRSRSVTTSLAKFMVAEGFHGTMMEWLKMLVHHDLGGQNGRMTDGIARQTFSHLLVDFVEAEIRFGGGFYSAIRQYLRVSEMHSQRTSSDTSTKPMLLAAAAHLNRSFMASKPESAQSSAALYDQFQEKVALLSPRSLLLASVAICHPTTPDASAFLKFVENISPNKFRAWNNVRRDAFFEIGSEALRVLVEQERFRQISRLESGISKLLPAETPAPAADRSYTVTEQDINLGFT